MFFSVVFSVEKSRKGKKRKRQLQNFFEKYSCENMEGNKVGIFGEMVREICGKKWEIWGWRKEIFCGNLWMNLPLILLFDFFREIIWGNVGVNRFWKTFIFVYRQNWIFGYLDILPNQWKTTDQFLFRMNTNYTFLVFLL